MAASSFLGNPEIYEPIEEFYSGKSVLITGGTGFVGKVLLEKLVYSCPKLANVYVLVREKKSVMSHDRFNGLLESELFSRIKKEKPQNLKKIIPIVGDITQCDLGMNEMDKNTLLDKVSVVFHLAATIKFDEPLKEAMRVNVEGTRNMIHFSQKMKNLQMFVYMSTAFCNTDKTIVEEIVYPAPVAIDDVYKFISRQADVNDGVTEILDGRPNTYSFTKALTESMVAEIRGNMPTVIIRPSVVVAAMREPIPGWIDKWVGPTPALDMVARGWLKCMYGNSGYAIDIIPVDYVINATIVAAARCRRSKKLSVYNCCTSTINTITLEQLKILYCGISVKSGYNEMPLNVMIFTQSSFILNLLTFVYQTIPAYVLDFILILKRKPTKYVKIMSKLLVYLRMIRFFSSRNWFMISTRLRDLAEDLDEMDKRKFPCNPSEISWSEFVPDYFNGVLKFLNGTNVKVRA